MTGRHEEGVRSTRPTSSSTPGGVRLRAVTEDDLPVLFEHQRDPEAARMAAFPSRDRAAFMDHWRSKVLGDESAVKRTVEVDGKVAGNVLCFEREGERLVGYWIGREYWGRGVASEALRLLLDEVTDRPLRARVAAHNAGSIRVLEKCGFTVVGRDMVPAEEIGVEFEELIMELR
jgi:RimJ/RimL family protein N-acetyltransferase